MTEATLILQQKPTVLQLSLCQLLSCASQVAHGNEDTFREMLRIKRSVTASFSQTHFNTTIIDAAATPASTGMGMLPQLLSLHTGSVHVSTSLAASCHHLGLQGVCMHSAGRAHNPDLLADYTAPVPLGPPEDLEHLWQQRPGAHVHSNAAEHHPPYPSLPGVLNIAVLSYPWLSKCLFCGFRSDYSCSPIGYGKSPSCWHYVCHLLMSSPSKGDITG